MRDRERKNGVCVRENERETVRKTERERERETKKKKEIDSVCERERLY